ncbi:MAG: peptidylprolyl isomerase [Bacteroidetes bacterium GWE2_29_8]|nr:MAG: peptidylprolyl isomerase [Bacteroidetes bacterium GWE2_29_8]
MDIAENIKNQGFDKLNIEIMSKAMSDIYEGKATSIEKEKSQNLIQTYFMSLMAKKGEEKTKKAKEFLDNNKKREGVTTLPSGLQYEVIKKGTGESPKLTDEVTTHYTGTLLDGKVFDSSVQRGEPATFPVNGVIPGWTEALQLMKVGDKWKLYIPSELAYGERGAGQVIGPNETLIFEIELLSINKKK